MAANTTKATKTMEDDNDITGIVLLSLGNPVFRCYLWWSSLLIVKMLLMALLTAARRFSSKTYENPEDLAKQTTEVKSCDPNVERSRRAHLNDLENIPAYLIMALLFITMNPNKMLARILFRVATLSRICHTLVYAFRPVPQPARTITFLITLSITVYMACYVIGRNVLYI